MLHDFSPAYRRGSGSLRAQGGVNLKNAAQSLFSVAVVYAAQDALANNLGRRKFKPGTFDPVAAKGWRASSSARAPSVPRPERPRRPNRKRAAPLLNTKLLCGKVVLVTGRLHRLDTSRFFFNAYDFARHKRPATEKDHHLVGILVGSHLVWKSLTLRFIARISDPFIYLQEVDARLKFLLPPARRDATQPLHAWRRRESRYSR